MKNKYNYTRLLETLKTDEGLRLYPYEDTVGKLTIGYGHNLEDNGIPLSIAELLLEHDLQQVIDVAPQIVSNYNELSPIRKEVLINMIFNMGFHTVHQFINMRNAIEHKNFAKAAEEMLDSRWADQVKTRAKKLAHMMQYNTLSSL